VLEGRVQVGGAVAERGRSMVVPAHAAATTARLERAHAVLSSVA
jgi:hypothetical protein